MLRDFNAGVSKDQKIRHRRKEDFQFINVDLELKSSANLQSLVKELDKNVYVLYNDKSPNLDEYWISLEIGGYDIYQSFDDKTEDVGGVDLILSAFCDLLEKLSSDSKGIWNKCNRREFDIGFTGGNTEKSFHTKIRDETIKRCAELGASILITVYPHLNYEIRQPSRVATD